MVCAHAHVCEHTREISFVVSTSQTAPQSQTLSNWIAMQSYEQYLIEYQAIIRFLPTISGRKWSGEIRQKPVYKGLLLKVGNGRKKILYFVSIGREFLLRLC